MRTDEDAQYRLNTIERINTQIFNLVYYGKFSYTDCENMTSVELRWYHTKLLETKEAENKQREDAMKSAKQAREVVKQNNQSRKSKPRKRR